MTQLWWAEPRDNGLIKVVGERYDDQGNVCARVHHWMDALLLEVALPGMIERELEAVARGLTVTGELASYQVLAQRPDGFKRADLPRDPPSWYRPSEPEEDWPRPAEYVKAYGFGPAPETSVWWFAGMIALIVGLAIFMAVLIAHQAGS